jgi:pectate lyase
VIGRRAVFFLVTALFHSPPAVGQSIPAFPGADGAAAHATGGRGGIVYHVTKLDRNFSHNEPGTLRFGLTNSNFTVAGQVQPRTIVFDVAGTFWLGRFGAEENHHNGWDTASRYNLGSNITVAGQTAPGPVYIMGGLVKAGGNNAILRNVTIAPGYGMRTFEKPDEDPPELPTPGDFPDSIVYDAIDITGTNILIDHVSTFYATDETISANEQADNVTIQYSNISQGQNYPQADAEGSGVRYTGHALGSLLQGGSNSKFSIHHNLYAHQKGRLPRVGSEVGTGAYNDFRNNVFYNWLGAAGSGASGQPSFNNFVANYWRAGPGGDDPQGGSSTNIILRAGGTDVFNGANSAGTRIYHTGNFKDTNKNASAEFTVPLANTDFGSSSFQPAPLWSQGEPTNGA